MALITQECLDEIRRHVQIVDVVAPYVQLKNVGKYLKGLSPFSNEKTPSFFVDQQRNTFKCFSTGNSGDMFRFLELKENLTFVESVEWIAEKFGIELKYGDGNKNLNSDTTFSSKKILYQIHECSMQFFRECFLNNQQKIALKTRKYWIEERQFALETAKEFDIGLSPLNPVDLYFFLKKQGFRRENIEESGLFYKPKAQYNDLVSRFQGRLMIPIRDIQGRIIAFSARKLPFVTNPNDPTNDSKYVNSPETKIFVKGMELFNLHKARKNLTCGSSFFLVEGQLDVMRCYECGIKTAIAPQGTGLTEEQLKILKRYDAPIIGFFDGDSAGIKAGIRLMTLGIPLEIQIRYYLLQQDEDPDSVLKNQLSLNEILSKAISPIEFFIHIFKKNCCDYDDLQHKVLQVILPIIAKCTSHVLRFDMLSELSEKLLIKQSVLEGDLKKFIKDINDMHYNNDIVTEIKKNDNVNSLEWRLLLFFFHAKQFIKTIMKHIELSWIDTGNANGQLLIKIIKKFRENEHVSLDNREIWDLTMQECSIWCDLLAENFIEQDAKEALILIILQMKRRFLKKMISDIDKKIRNNLLSNTDNLRQLQIDRVSYKKDLSKVSDSICID